MMTIVDGRGGVDTGRGLARAARMGADWSRFEELVSHVVERFLAQGGAEAPATAIARFASQLARLVRARGLPRPLPPGETGAPGGMAEAECAPLVAAVMEGLDHPRLAEAARQLVKACFYPEFTLCRESYRETGRDGACRRQELARVLGRVSGAHCVDCPYWVSLDPVPHQALLRDAWVGRPGEFEERTGVFLPEDFRRLRTWLHHAARVG